MIPSVTLTTVTSDDADLRLFSPQYRALVVGVVGIVVAVAFEAIAVATAMPVAARELHGLRGYGLAFSVFLTTSLLGMVVAGEMSDRRGPVRPFIDRGCVVRPRAAGRGPRHQHVAAGRGAGGAGLRRRAEHRLPVRRRGARLPRRAAAAGVLGHLQRLDPAVAHRASGSRPARRPRVLALGLPRRAAPAAGSRVAGAAAPGRTGRSGRGAGDAAHDSRARRRGAGRGRSRAAAVRRPAAQRAPGAGGSAGRGGTGAARGRRAAAAPGRRLPARARPADGRGPARGAGRGLLRDRDVHPADARRAAVAGHHAGRCLADRRAR